MTHVTDAVDLLRGELPGSDCIIGSVTVAVLFGQHVFEHKLTLANLMRLVDPSTLCRAEPSPRWQLRGGAMTHAIEEESDSDSDSDSDEEPKSKKRKKKKKKKKKRVSKPAYETAGRYINSMEAFDEYEAVTALGKATDAKEKDAVVAARRAEIVKEQEVYRDSLRASYATYHLGGALSMVLGQCLQRLAESKSIDQVWAALYRNVGWLEELESAARAAGNTTLSETARKLLDGEMPT
jgi:hypothetical protein